MQCEICGRKDASMRALIEGTPMVVCPACAGYGKALAQPVAPRRFVTPLRAQPVVEEYVASGCGSVIKAAREKRGLSHKELAQALAEKESLIAHIEGGHAEPSIPLARKIERFLGVVLVESITSVPSKSAAQRSESSSLTIGDTIRVRKR